jgi:hypothetical protein
MAVLVEANSVVVRVQAVHERYAGGWAAFDETVPNNTLCSDNEVARVGFMDPNDAEAFIASLERHGLTFLNAGKSQNIAFAVQGSGITVPCDWLEYGNVDLKPGATVAAVQLKGTKSQQVVCPEGWAYERSLSRASAVVPPQHLDKSLKFLRRQDNLDVYLNVLTGTEVFIGRPELKTDKE